MLEIVIGVIIAIAIALALFFIIMAKRYTQNETVTNSSQKETEYNRQLQKFKTNTYVQEWALQVTDFILQDINNNLYTRKDYDVCCYENRICIVTQSNERTIFTYYFAKYNLENLSCEAKINNISIDECDILATALAEDVCELLKQHNIETETSFETYELSIYVNDYDKENSPSICTIVYEGLKGKNKW